MNRVVFLVLIVFCFGATASSSMPKEKNTQVLALAGTLQTASGSTGSHVLVGNQGDAKASSQPIITDELAEDYYRKKCADIVLQIMQTKQSAGKKFFANLSQLKSFLGEIRAGTSSISLIADQKEKLVWVIKARKLELEKLKNDLDSKLPDTTFFFDEDTDQHDVLRSTNNKLELVCGVLDLLNENA